MNGAEHGPCRPTCHLPLPILQMTNGTVSLSRLSLDLNVMGPRQLLNILNVSLTRTNPVEFFSNFPIRWMLQSFKQALK